MTHLLPYPPNAVTPQELGSLAPLADPTDPRGRYAVARNHMTGEVLASAGPYATEPGAIGGHRSLQHAYPAALVDIVSPAQLCAMQGTDEP